MQGEEECVLCLSLECITNLFGAPAKFDVSRLGRCLQIMLTLHQQATANKCPTIAVPFASHIIGLVFTKKQQRYI